MVLGHLYLRIRSKSINSKRWSIKVTTMRNKKPINWGHYRTPHNLLSPFFRLSAAPLAFSFTPPDTALAGLLTAFPPAALAPLLVLAPSLSLLFPPSFFSPALVGAGSFSFGAGLNRGAPLDWAEERRGGIVKPVAQMSPGTVGKEVVATPGD